MGEDICVSNKCDAHPCNTLAKTKNFSGAEIAGVCRSAASFATNRCIRCEGGKMGGMITVKLAPNTPPHQL
jgi:hypothetical protein